MSGPTPKDWPIRLVLALIRGAIPIVGVTRYDWSVQYVGFYFWIELVMIGLFFAAVAVRESHGKRGRVPFLLKVPLFLVGYQVAAIMAGVILTLAIEGPLAKLEYLGELLRDPTLRGSALVQAAITLASALAWNHRRAGAEAALDLQWTTMASRFVTTLALGGAGLLFVAIYIAANEQSGGQAARLAALVSAWVVGITWAASDAFPRQFNRFIDWCLKSREPRGGRYDSP